AEGAAAVERRLKAEPDLARALVALARDEAVLRLWARAARSADAVWAAANLPPPAAPRRRRRLWFAAGLAAAAAVAAVALRPALRRDRPPPGRAAGPPDAPALAHLDDVQGDVFVLLDGERRRLAGGDGVADGQEVVAAEDGGAVVRYADGTRLALGGGTRL